VKQYVFLDGRSVGVVPPSQQIALDAPAGTHIVLVSDAPDGKNNPEYIAESYDAGYEYRYEVVAR
jgi:hypothetical protein